MVMVCALTLALCAFAWLCALLPHPLQINRLFNWPFNEREAPGVTSKFLFEIKAIHRRVVI